MSAPSVNTSNFTAAAGAVNYVNAQTDPVTATLPDATANVNGLPPAGQVVAYIYVQSAAKPVTLQPAGSQTINGQPSLTVNLPGLYSIVSDGANCLASYQKLVGTRGWAE